MHRRLSLIGVASICIAGLLIAGCGSSSSTSSSTSTTTTTAAISKAEFIAKGNVICLAGNKTQNASFERFAKEHGLSEKSEPNKAQTEELVETVFAPNIQRQIDAIKALGAPSGEEQQLNEALETAQEALSKVEANPELFKGKQNPFHEAGLKLHALGLVKCAANS
jgi:basic membrane lipoprotein Med (substrate-binding protein (PBP1-ABC) superfamily)